MGDEKVENTEDSKKIGNTGDLAILGRAGYISGRFGFGRLRRLQNK